MTRLRIRSATGNPFGRLRNRTVDLGDHDFVVVHGRNEAGKSTLAELISIVLAGRSGREADLYRWVNDGLGPVADPDWIGGSVVGVLAGVDFSVTREVGVRRAKKGSRGSDLDKEPQVTLGGQKVSPEEWLAKTSLTSHDEYTMRHRLTDREEDIAIKELLESLAAGSGTRVSPVRVLARLTEGAHECVIPAGGTDRTNTRAKTAKKKLGDSAAAITEAKSAERELAQADDEITRVEAELRNLEQQTLDLVAERDDIAAALSAWEARQTLVELRERQAAAPVAPPEWQQAVTRHAEVESLLTRLKHLEEEREAALRDISAVASVLGLDSLGVDAVVVAPGTLAEVVRHRGTLATARGDIASRRADLTRLESSLQEARSGLARIADALGTGEAALRRMVDHPLQDTTLTEKLAVWQQAQQSVAAAEAELAGDGAPSPEETSGTADTSRVVALAAAALTAAAVGAAVNRWLGVALAIVGAVALVVVGRRAPTATGTDNGAERGAMSESRVAVARSAERAFAAEVRTMFDELGVESGEEVARALALRDARTRARELISDEQAKLQDIGRTAESLAGVEAGLADAEQRLAIVAKECGLVHIGSDIDEQSLGSATSLVEARGRRDRATEKMADVRESLVEKCGADLVGSAGADAALAALGEATGRHQVLTSLAADIAAASSTVEGAWGSRPGARDLVEVSGLGRESLEERRNVVATEIDALRNDMADGQQRLGALRQTQRELAGRADLPALLFAQAQAEQHLVETVTEGAARWLAAKLVEDVKSEVERRNQPSIIRAAGDLVSAVTGGEWLGIVVDDDVGVLKVMYRDGTTRAESALSSGARDLLRLAVRVAVADAHAEQTGVALPLICDDPTGDIDAGRTPEIMRILAHCAETRQVILLTHDDRTVEAARAVGAVPVPLVD